MAEIHVKSGHTLAEVTAECRRLGITRWSDGDTTIELGTEPSTDGDKAETQQDTDPETLEKRRRASQHATSMSAVGRLVPRFARDE